MHKKLVALLCFGLMITIAGCGASNPPTTPATGQVKYDGEALEGATVTLTPEAGSADTRTASGITDADGNFTLTTVFADGQNADGILPGSYSVRITKLEAVETLDGDGLLGDPGESDPSAAYEASVMQMSEDGENAGPKSLINEAFGAYTELDNWKNKVEIMAGGEAGAAAPATLTITLQDNGSGEVTLQ